MVAGLAPFSVSAEGSLQQVELGLHAVLVIRNDGGIGGTATDIRINAELILHMKRVMAELTAEQTGKSVEQINADADRDRWFTADQALEYGFIDHVVATSAAAGGAGM